MDSGNLQRRSVLGAMVLSVAGLSACGFQLRRSQPMPFQTLAVTPEKGGGVAGELARYFGAAIRPLAPGKDAEPPEAVLDVLQEIREKTVVGVNASGQVREFQLRIRVRFRLRTFQGTELIVPVEIEQRRDISFNESAVLAKEAEEALLYRDMQSDIVQQIVRRVSAVKSLGLPVGSSPVPAASASALPASAPTDVQK